MFNIRHQPIFDTQKVINHYSKKDGVPVSYVCTTALGHGVVAGDIFFRSTPHPEFGNRYFILTERVGNIYIGNADKVEDLEFDCIGDEDGWYYSAHRHDYHYVLKLGVAIDGGRSYLLLSGDALHNVGVKTFVVVDGDFKEKEL